MKDRIKKYICIFNEVTSASQYGVGTYIEQIKSSVSSLPDLSFNIIILSDEVEELYVEKKEGVRFVYIPKNNSKYYDRNLTYILRLYLPVSPDDEVYFHFNFYQHIGLMGLLKEIYPHSIVIFTIHYLFWGFALKGDVGYFKKIIHKREEDLSDVFEISIYNSYKRDKATFEKIDKIVCLCQATYWLLIDEYLISPEKVYLIPNGIEDEGVILSQSKKEQLKRKLSFAENERVILYVGRLDPLKGIDILIEAFQFTVATEPQCRLVIAGDSIDEFSSRYNDKHTEKIVFTGRLSKHELYDYYKIADVGVLPSFIEQCSYTAIEMLMFGVPLITSTAMGLNEMLDDSFDKFDIEAYRKNADKAVKHLCKMILRCLNASLSKSLYRKVFLDKYQRGIVSPKVLELYDI